MQLTNEEKKRIADAATMMLQTFCEYKIAEDRLRTMNTMMGKALEMGLPSEMVEAALVPYRGRVEAAQRGFFETLGIGEGNKEFWEYVSKVEGKSSPQGGGVAQ